MLTEHSKSAGADAVLIVSPYYNSLRKRVVFTLQKIAESVDIPNTL